MSNIVKYKKRPICTRIHALHTFVKNISNKETTIQKNVLEEFIKINYNKIVTDLSEEEKFSYSIFLKEIEGYIEKLEFMVK